MERYETVIIGGGQAGLSVGYYLQKRSRPFVIVDASERIGDSWRQRWDSLKLYSPAFRDGLPGMRFPAKRTAYPTKDEFADYLEAYTESFELPVRSGVSVDALTKEDGKYVVHTGDGGFEADNVVVATGVFKKPYTPDFAAELNPSITQLHSNDYRNLSQLQTGPVLVVGASHSGSDVAWEAASKYDVVLAGKDTGQIPASIESRRGRLGFRLLFFAGTYILTADTPMGRKMGSHIRHGGAPLLRYRRKDLLRAGVERVLERVVGVKDGMPVLEGGRVLDVRNVVWCTGFRPDFSWIRLPYEIGNDGYPVQYQVPLHHLRASTSQACPSCTRSRRCSSVERGATPSASRSTSSRCGHVSSRRSASRACWRSRTSASPRDRGRPRVERPRLGVPGAARQASHFVHRHRSSAAFGGASRWQYLPLRAGNGRPLRASRTTRSRTWAGHGPERRSLEEARRSPADSRGRGIRTARPQITRLRSPSAVRPALALTAAEEVETIRRVLREAATSTSRQSWATCTCPECGNGFRQEISVPDHGARIKAVETLLREGLGRVGEAEFAERRCLARWPRSKLSAGVR